MEFAVSYGEKLQFKGWQKSIFILAQQRFVTALIASGKLEEAASYLNDYWGSKRNSRLYRQCKSNVCLMIAFDTNNVKKYNDCFEQAESAFKKSKVYRARKDILNQRYEEAVNILCGYKEKAPYHEVMRNYLLGMCYDMLNYKELAKECMEYTVKYGNVMPCKKKAEEWLIKKY